ncbi:MAG: hypothetical protein CMF72_00900 [Mameliella sp.]|nr:hypothetical protein [Mameliella sp.]
MKQRNRLQKLVTILTARPPTGQTSNMSLENFVSFAEEEAPVLDAKMRYVFFTHNKVAQTSINRNLMSHRSIVMKDSRKIYRLALHCYMRSWSRGQPVTFTIVRNPFSRTLSGFDYLRRTGKIPKEAEFNAFVTGELARTGTGFDPHFMPQEKFSVPLKEMGFDCIINIENIDAEWPALAARIDAPVSLPHENRTKKKEQEWSLLFTNESIEVIEKLYARDFANLGYQTWSDKDREVRTLAPVSA